MPRIKVKLPGIATLSSLFSKMKILIAVYFCRVSNEAGACFSRSFLRSLFQYTVPKFSCFNWLELFCQMLRQTMAMLPSNRKFLPILLAILQFSSTTIATCYNYNGSAVTISTYKPCNGSAPVSMCCNLGQGGNGGDACGSGSTYGLCGVTGNTLWRESCSDPTWQSPVCLKLCVTGISMLAHHSPGTRYP